MLNYDIVAPDSLVSDKRRPKRIRLDAAWQRHDTDTEKQLHECDAARVRRYYVIFSVSSSRSPTPQGIKCSPAKMRHISSCIK